MIFLNKPKRFISIGRRKINDLTKEELIDFIYNVKECCASNEFWDAPVITEFYLDDSKSDVVYFTFHQTQKADKVDNPTTKAITGRINFNLNPRIYLDAYGSYNFKLEDINHFIRLGFYFPIGSSLYKPKK